MSHFIEIDGVKEKIYQLIEMALSAENFVSRYGIGVEGAERYISKDQYWRHTKSILSNYSLEIAVKLRNAAELLESKSVSFTLNSAISIYNSGSKADGTRKEKDIKFIFNKIIHAKSFFVDVVGSCEKHENLLWWAGTLTLSGTDQSGKEWCFFFNILEWCEASLSFLDEIESNLQNFQFNSDDLALRRLS